MRGVDGISDDIILKGQSICCVSNRTDYKSSGLAVSSGEHDGAECAALGRHSKTVVP